MVKHIVFYSVLLVLAAVLLVVHTVILNRRKLSLSAVLEATNFGNDRQCSVVVDTLSSAMQSCAAADSDKVSSVVSTLMNTIAAKKQRAAEKVCGLCVAAPEACALDPELGAFILKHCDTSELGDLPESNIATVVVDPITPVAPRPTIPVLKLVSSTDSAVTLMWSELDSNTSPILKMVSPTTAVVDTLDSTTRQFTWPSSQSMSTTALQPDTAYAFTLGVKRGSETFFSDSKLEVRTRTPAVYIPQSSVDAASLTDSEFVLLWRQPSEADRTVLLRFNGGLVLDESTTPIVIANETPGLMASRTFDGLNAFSWYTWCLGIRVVIGDRAFDTWGDPQTARTRTPEMNAPPLLSMSKGIDFFDISWDALAPGESARIFVEEGPSVSAATIEDDAQGVAPETNTFMFTGLKPGTMYTAVLKVFRIFVDVNEALDSPFRNVMASSTSSVSVTTEVPVYVTPSAIMASATDTTLTLYWNATIPAGYSPMVLLSTGNVLSMVPAGASTMRYNLDDDFTTLNTSSLVTEIIPAAGTWIAYNLQPSTTYVVALVLRKENLVIVYGMKPIVITTSMAPKDLKYPVIQSIRAVSTQSSSILQVLWKQPPLALSGSIAAAFLKILPDPYKALNASLTNAGVAGISNLRENRSSDLLAGSDLGGIDIVVDPQVPLYTLSLNYFFTEDVAVRSAISKPRSQRPVWWKLPTLSNTLKVESYAPGPNGTVAVTLSWVPLDISMNTAMYGPVSAEVAVNTTKVPIALSTARAVFNVAPSMVHTFSVTYRNNRNVDSVTAELSAFVDKIPPVVTLGVEALSTMIVVTWDQSKVAGFVFSLKIGVVGDSVGQTVMPTGGVYVFNNARPGTDYYIQAVLANATNQITTLSDLVEVRTLPLLVMGAPPVISSVSTTSAVVALSGALPVNSDPKRVQCRILVGATPAYSFTLDQAPSTFTFTSLQSATTYTASVQCQYSMLVGGIAYTDTSSVTQSAAAFFMTLFATKLAFTFVSSNSAVQVSWVNPAETAAFSVYVRYRLAGTSTWTTLPPTQKTTDTFTINGAGVYEVQGGRFKDDVTGLWDPTQLTVSLYSIAAYPGSASATVQWPASNLETYKPVLQYRMTSDTASLSVPATSSSVSISGLRSSTAYTCMLVLNPGAIGNTAAIELGRTSFTTISQFPTNIRAYRRVWFDNPNPMVTFVIGWLNSNDWLWPDSGVDAILAYFPASAPNLIYQIDNDTPFVFTPSDFRWYWTYMSQHWIFSKSNLKLIYFYLDQLAKTPSAKTIKIGRGTTAATAQWDQIINIEDWPAGKLLDDILP